MHIDAITERVIGCAIEVHKELGPGLLESAYQRCLYIAMRGSGLSVDREVWLSLVFSNTVIPEVCRVDFIVEGRLVVEVKAIEKLGPIQMAQTLGYQKLTGCRVGLLLNFGVETMSQGIRRPFLPAGAHHSASSLINNPRALRE